MEPTYQYIRGRGWIACQPNILEMADGTLVTIEFRKPELGEYFTWNDVSDGWRPDVEWRNWVQRTRLDCLDTYRPGRNEPGRNRNVDWIVLILV